MAGRVIQGFFLGGRMPARLGVPRAQQSAIAPAHRLGPPPLAFAGRGAAMQARPAPAHARAPVVQPFAAADSIAIDAAALGLARGGGQPLPQALLAKMEAAFGADFSGVRIHVGAQASRIGAVAFTTGNDLYFAPGQFQPNSVKGQQLIGHELAHVIQQRQGRVRAPGNGLAVVQDRVLEAEADRLGMRAAAHRVAAGPHNPTASGMPGAARPAQLRAFGTPAWSIQRMKSQWDSDEDVYSDDSGSEYEFEEESEDGEEFVTEGTARPGAYSSIFNYVYTGGKFSPKPVDTVNGTITYVCAEFPCNTTVHSDRCNGKVYAVQSSYLSPTTPVTKKKGKKKKYKTVLEKPHICHIVDWSLLRDSLNDVTKGSAGPGLKKFVCWGNINNLTTGRRTCNIKSNKKQLKYGNLSYTKKNALDKYVSDLVILFNKGTDQPGDYGPVPNL